MVHDRTAGALSATIRDAAIGAIILVAGVALAKLASGTVSWYLPASLLAFACVLFGLRDAARRWYAFAALCWTAVVMSVVRVMLVLTAREQDSMSINGTDFVVVGGYILGSLYAYLKVRRFKRDGTYDGDATW